MQNKQLHREQIMSEEEPSLKDAYNPLLERPGDREEENIAVADQFELLTRFAMEQNLAHYGYGDKLQHLNKNILFTNLKREFNEPEEIRKLSRALTILSGHTQEEIMDIRTGQYEQIGSGDTTVTAREIIMREKVIQRRFKRLETYIASKVYAITSTSAGANAKLLETLKSTFLHKETSIEDKTETKGGLWAKMKGKPGSSR
jgi:hypothetical protein